MLRRVAIIGALSFAFLAIRAQAAERPAAEWVVPALPTNKPRRLSRDRNWKTLWIC